MNIDNTYKAINKLASLVTNQKNCRDTFFSSQEDMKKTLIDIEKKIMFCDDSGQLVKYKEQRSNILHELKIYNSLHKYYYFVSKYLNIKRISGDIYSFNDVIFKASNILSAIDYALDDLEIKNKSKYINEINSIEKHNLTIEQLLLFSGLNKKSLFSIAIHNPEHFHCLLIGVKHLIKRSKPD